MHKLGWVVATILGIATTLLVWSNGMLLGEKLVLQQELRLTKAEYLDIYNKYFEYRKSKWEKR